jgi:hypothetical protein
MTFLDDHMAAGSARPAASAHVSEADPADNRPRPLPPLVPIRYIDVALVLLLAPISLVLGAHA